MLKFDYSNVLNVLAEDELLKTAKRLNMQNVKLHDGTGSGSEYLGWVDVNKILNTNSFDDIASSLKEFSKLDVIVCVGIGGSYLGARSVITALRSSFGDSNPEMIYAGHHFGEDYHQELLKYLADKEFGVIVISKSGTTTEPAVAFRFLLNLLRSKYLESKLKDRIIAITDAKSGALRKLADKLDLPSFIIPDNIGGRFSVLSPVGLVPILCAGIDAKSLLNGAASMAELCHPSQLVEKNPALMYAALRNKMWEKNKSVEILANADPRLSYIAEWWKQLFGESEGKDGKGIFPTSVNLTTDLHSMGQFIQDGNPVFFETILQIEEIEENLKIQSDGNNYDDLNYLVGKSVDYINKQATQGTIEAHVSGGVPLSQIKIQKLDAWHVGQLLYFFEKSCGISAYSLGVNPFNQPGVEAYKRNMFRLLGKPGII